MFLDRTYFVGALSLPMLTVSPATAIGDEIATQTVGEYSLEWFIARYEPEFLHKLLGRTLANNFMQGMEAASPLEIWTDLRDVIYPTGSIRLSPAANYVYFHAMRWAAYSQTAMTGEVRHKPSYAVNINPAEKLVEAWSDMSEPIRGIMRFLCKNWDKYSRYADCRPCAGRFRPINSLGL